MRPTKVRVLIKKVKLKNRYSRWNRENRERFYDINYYLEVKWSLFNNMYKGKSEIHICNFHLSKKHFEDECKRIIGIDLREMIQEKKKKLKDKKEREDFEKKMKQFASEAQKFKNTYIEVVI